MSVFGCRLGLVFSFFGNHLHVTYGSQCLVVLVNLDLFIYKKGRGKDNRKGFDIFITADPSGSSKGSCVDLNP